MNHGKEVERKRK